MQLKHKYALRIKTYVSECQKQWRGRIRGKYYTGRQEETRESRGNKTQVAREISGNSDITVREEKENRVQGRGKIQRKTGGKERG